MSATSAAPDVEAECTAARAEIDQLALKNGDGPAGELAKRLQKAKDQAKQELDGRKADFDKIAAPGRDKAAITHIREFWKVVGNISGVTAQMDRLPVVVSLMPGNVDINDATAIVTDIKLKVRNNTIVPDQTQKLKVEIDGTLNVIQTVFVERLRVGPGWRLNANGLFIDQAVWTREVEKSRSGYLRELFGIAQVGLETTEPTRIAFAKLDLTRLQQLFVLREAGTVKNDYVRRLLFCSIVAIGIFVVAYVVAISYPPAPAAAAGAANDSGLGARLALLNWSFRNFYLLAAGTAFGTWLSFSIRRQELSFTELAVLEPDRLNPRERIIFMIGLSGLIGLLLFCNAVVAGVGNVTGLAALHTNGSSALLLGLLAGVAERTLGSAVSKRASDFAAVLGGDKTAPGKAAQ